MRSRNAIGFLIRVERPARFTLLPQPAILLTRYTIFQDVTMRLADQEIDTIKQTVAEIFGPDAVVSLFGSRVDDADKGGDIDLLIESSQVIQDRQRKILHLVALLQMKLGDQPIDVLVIDPSTKKNKVHESALATGIRL